MVLHQQAPVGHAERRAIGLQPQSRRALAKLFRSPVIEIDGFDQLFQRRFHIAVPVRNMRIAAFSSSGWTSPVARNSIAVVEKIPPIVRAHVICVAVGSGMPSVIEELVFGPNDAAPQIVQAKRHVVRAANMPEIVQMHVGTADRDDIARFRTEARAVISRMQCILRITQAAVTPPALLIHPSPMTWSTEGKLNG